MKSDKATVLIVDDESYPREFFEDLLGEEGYLPISVASGKDAVKICREENVDLMLLDLRLSGENGLDVLKEIKQISPDIPVIIMTGFASIESAVNAMKLGAADYLTKPFESIEEIKLIIQKNIERKLLYDENKYLRQQLKNKFRIGNLIGKSNQMQEVYRLIEKVAPTNSTILIEGDSGTGKEVVAHTIHINSSRSDRKFMPINCGGVPETLLESTLFGYEKGAFTGAYKTTKGYFEEADGGTVFLDEIGETSPNLQVRLLRVLQEKAISRVGGSFPIETNVRIIAATNKDLLELVHTGKFREDLFYRINVITIDLPPLREREGDIPLLAVYFLQKNRQEISKDIKRFSPEALKALENYEWHGNVRELENVIERAMVMEDTNEITLASLPQHIAKKDDFGFVDEDIVDVPLTQAKEHFEKKYLLKLLDHLKGNITQAAQVAELPRQNLYQKFKKYGIDPQKFRDS
jgi:DNA-binding NtrC family response regulator